MDMCNANDQGTVTASTRGTAVTGGNGSYGSYAQLVASTPYDTCAVLVSLQSNAGVNTAVQNSVRLAIGGSGSEQVLIPDLIIPSLWAAYDVANYFFPIQISAGTRLSAAGYCSGATDTVYANVTLFDGSFTNAEGCAGVDSIGWASGQGTAVTTGAANTKGSYAQLTASSTKDYKGFVLRVDNQNSTASYTGIDSLLFDIAIGGAGSEQVILPNYPIGRPKLSTNGAAASITGSPSAHFPIQIPAGTRIAARAQSILASQIMGVTLYGVY
ncbi:hypothetical protein C7G41_24200 [Bradyrhizobium sp. MOS002]|nr:hypothetical protein C7G41_24200 [Bradyrhizobium sp. MOS002]